MNLNKAIVLGRLTADPESRSLPSGQSVANFSLATNRVWSDKDGNRQEATEFHNIVLFGKIADVANQYLAKGQLCLIVGRIQTRSWEGKDGQKRYQTEIIGRELQLGPKSAGTSSPSSPRSKPQQKKQEEENEVDVEDIPF
jgi:single-strand DNA-binding protein